MPIYGKMLGIYDFIYHLENFFPSILFDVCLFLIGPRELSFIFSFAFLFLDILIKDMYHGAKTHVRTCGRDTEVFPFADGIT